MSIMLVNVQVLEVDVIYLKFGMKVLFIVLGDLGKCFDGVLKDIQLILEKVNDVIFYLVCFEVLNFDWLL